MSHGYRNAKRQHKVYPVVTEEVRKAVFLEELAKAILAAARSKT